MNGHEQPGHLMEKMKFIDFLRPVLTEGWHTVTAIQEVDEPETRTFSATEDFYVAGRAYTLDVNEVFTVSPTENECGDFSHLIPFITLENQNFPWERRIAEAIDETPVPWVALIVISSGEPSEEKDIAVSELLSGAPAGVFFPDRNTLPPVVTEKDDDSCHIVDIPATLYRAIMPEYRDMTCLTHVRRVDLADTEDAITAKDGDFSVVMANRLIPSGEGDPLKSTVHLVSLLGMPREIPEGYGTVRLVSLHRWNVYSVKDRSVPFRQLIDGLGKNTGTLAHDRDSEALRQGCVPKKHMTRSGESTYSLYRSPLIPYANEEMDCSAKSTADGHLIYNQETGIFDASYAAAFQLGRLISLNRKADAQAVAAWRKSREAKAHRELLRANIDLGNVENLCRNLVQSLEHPAPL
jgi:hypothetical protein